MTLILKFWSLRQIPTSFGYHVNGSTMILDVPPWSSQKWFILEIIGSILIGGTSKYYSYRRLNSICFRANYNTMTPIFLSIYPKNRSNLARKQIVILKIIVSFHNHKIKADRKNNRWRPKYAKNHALIFIRKKKFYVYLLHK